MLPTVALLLPLAHAKRGGLTPSSATSGSSPGSSVASSPKAPATSREEDEHSAEDESTASTRGNESRASPVKAARGRRVSASKKSAAETAPKPKKVRKRTYYMRKEELAQLTQELKALEDTNAQLMARAMAARKREAALVTERQNAAINDAIRGQRLLFANAHSMFTQFMRVQEQSPFETFIQLGSDPLARHATLQAMKRQKLRSALEFLEARAAHLDVSSDFCEHQKFTNHQGDQCYMSFDVTPLPRASTSVKAVFDVLLNFAYTFEMSISEVLGDITIRENDDSWDPSVAQHRLVTLVGNSVQMETNQVMFTEYFSQGPAFPGETDCAPLSSPSSPSSSAPAQGQELGILATDFVNDDALFPYRTDERLRQDVTVLTMVKRGRSGPPKNSIVSSHDQVRSLDGSSQASKADSDDELVVLVRWALIRVRKSAIPLASDLRRRLHEGMQKVDEAMINNVRASIGPRPSTFSILHPTPMHHTLLGSFESSDGMNNGLFR